jgi:nucleotide-binding universal stress UspA family protein
MVVLGAQGKSLLERMLFGGHAAHAMQNLKWPIIAVPPSAAFSTIKKIALACDLREVVDSTPVKEIENFVHDFGATLDVVNTGSELDFNPDLVFQSGLLQELFAHINPQYHFLSNKNTEEGILQFVKANQTDLLVVLPREHDLVDKLVHKSHTKAFVLHSEVPVLALRQG